MLRLKEHKIDKCIDWTFVGLNKLSNTLIKETNLGKTGRIYVNYGQVTEPVAFEKYQELNEVEKLKAGLVIHCKMPWVCVSNDGVVPRMENFTKFLR